MSGQQKIQKDKPSPPKDKPEEDHRTPSGKPMKFAASSFRTTT